MKLTRHYKKLLKDAVKLAYQDIDVDEERKLLEVIDSLKVEKSK